MKKDDPGTSQSRLYTIFTFCIVAILMLYSLFIFENNPIASIGIIIIVFIVVWASAAFNEKLLSTRQNRLMKLEKHNQQLIHDNEEHNIKMKSKRLINERHKIIIQAEAEALPKVFAKDGLRHIRLSQSNTMSLVDLQDSESWGYPSKKLD